MKRLAVIFLIITALGCSAKYNGIHVGNSNTYMPVIRSGNYAGFDYFYGLKNTDTLVFVVVPGIKAERGRRVAHIKYNELHTIDKLIIREDTLHFVYSWYDEYSKPVATVGSGSPGQMQQTMHTFKSFPYLIENDSVFVYEDK